MMKTMRLIDANAFLEHETKRCDNQEPYIGTCSTNNFKLSYELDNIPVMDAVPVVHGEWDEYDCFCCNSDGEPVVKTGAVFVCSVCGREEKQKEPYCYCGAKMDGGDNDEEVSTIEWHKVKTRPLTEEEKEYYAEIGELPEYIFDCPMPDDGEEILIASKWGVDMDICCNEYEYGISLEKNGDWDGILAWAKLPTYQVQENGE